MKILHFISRLGAGGAERVLLMLMREQLAAGHEVHWCALNGGNTAAERLVGFPEPTVLHYSFSRRDVSGRRRCSRQIDSLVNEVRPDIVHSHLWPVSRIVEKSLPHPKPVHVVHVQDTLPWLWENDWRSRMDRWYTAKLFEGQGRRTFFLAVSQSTLEQTRAALGFPAERFLKVLNPVDPLLAERLIEIPRDRPHGADLERPVRIGTASRLEPSKGIDRLIQAVAELRAKGIAVECRIAGHGSDRQRLESMAEEGVHFLGDCPDIVEVLEQFDIFVLPSLGSEGLSLAQLEAMISGIPVVVTDVAGAKEAARDGIDGLVVEAGDTAALTIALESLVRDADLRRRLGSSARRRVAKEFTAERMTGEVERIYELLLHPEKISRPMLSLTPTPV